jgi:hypothetical protein
MPRCARGQVLIGRDDLAIRLEGELQAWAEEAERLRVAEDPLDELWTFCARRANLSLRTREFLERWRGQLAAGYAAVAHSGEALRLVEDRERSLKGNRSRFGNARALELWGGQSGTGLLTYRRGTAQRFLGDLYCGLDREGN